MAKQLLRVSANEFTPAIGSNISVSGSALICDDYSISPVLGTPQRIARNPSTGRIWMRPSGGAPAAVWYTNAALTDAWTQVNLSDAFTQWSSGLAVDDDDSFYKIGTTERKVRKYNSGGVHQWTSAWTAHHGCMFYLPTNHIYFCDNANNRVREVDKAGNVITDRLLTDDLAQGTLPSDVFIDSTGIYILCARATDARIMKYDLAWNYQSNIQVGFTDTLPYQLFRYGGGMIRLSNGDFILGSFQNSVTHFTPLIQVDSAGVLKRALSNYGIIPEKGEAKSTGSFSSNATCFGLTQDDLYFATAVNGVVVLIDIRDCNQRYATITHNFDGTVNVKNIAIKAKQDNLDDNWKVVRAYYNIGEGDVEIDLADGNMNVACSSMLLKICLQSYGVTRNWPEFYYVDLVYEDNVISMEESEVIELDSTIETLGIDEEATEIIDLEDS